VGAATNLRLALSIASYSYTGGTSPNWDTATANNWSSTNPSGMSTFGDGGYATFDDTNTSTNNNITVVGQVRTAGLTVTNNLGGPNPLYTIGNGGTIRGSGGLTKNGTGALTLSGTNLFTGKTIINGGTVTIVGDQSLGAAPAGVVVDQLTLNGGTVLKVTTGTAANAGAGMNTLATNRGITLGSGTATLDITAITHTAATPGTNELGTENSLVYNGVITGPGSLTVVGSGGAQENSAASTAPQSILNLGAPATYQGATTIDNAIVQVNSGNTGLNNAGQLDDVLPVTTTLNLINNGSFNMASTTSDLVIAGLGGDATSRIGTTNSATPVILTLDETGSFNFAGIIGGFMVSGKQGSDAMFSLIKNGPGTQTLSGTNTYTGATTVNNGALIITGSIAGSPATVTGNGRIDIPAAGTAGAITINSGSASVNGVANQVTLSGGTLTGTGTVSVVSVGTGGTLRPGNPVGTLNTADIFFDVDSRLTIEIASLMAFGKLSVTGGVTMSGQLDLVQSPTYQPSPGDTFFVVSNDSIDAVFGTFSNVIDNGDGTGAFTSLDGAIYRISYSSDADTNTFAPGSGNDIALQVISVPEPSSIAGLLGGMACLLGFRRSRRA
jgi:autotransporter-associated beta strand protein